MKRLIKTVIFIILGTELAFSLNNDYLAHAQVENKENQETQVMFECDNTKEFPQIVVKHNEQKPVVFLSWIPKYFPQTELAVQECQKAAQRLQNQLEAHGNLDSFQLTLGKVNDISVACLIQKRERCTEENLIFYLDKIENPEEVLDKMLNRDLLPDIRGDFRIRSVPFRWLPF